MATEGQTSARPGRCTNHPAVARVGGCDVCGRSLCVSCAVPVRGRLIGPECLSKVLVDPPPIAPVPAPVDSKGERLVLLGFAVVLIASVFPWSRFGDSSDLLGAWTSRWSLVAAVGAALGMLIVLIGRYRPADPRVTAASFVLLAGVVAAAAYRYYSHPPLLSESTVLPLLAVAGAGTVMIGAGVKLVALLRARRPPR